MLLSRVWRFSTYFVLLLIAVSLLRGQSINEEDDIEEDVMDILDYYKQPGMMTSITEYADMLGDLPAGISGLCRVVQGTMLHVFWAEEYGVELTEDRKKEVNLRRVEDMLVRIAELDERPITEARRPEARVVGNCRDYAVFLCALLRSMGIPARARCGFATYFTPGKYEDHWICEYWNAEDERWVQVDTQLDSLQLDYLKIDFDPHDLPAGKFLNGGQAWQLCRSGEVDPDLFGIFDMKGLWFVQGDLVRDFMALNKVEVLPWDCNELMGGPDLETAPEDYKLLDRIADLICTGDDVFSDLRLIYESNDRVRMPADW
ncbi:MAG: transglutaminase domain-containing protein [candidate division WOR-3 bacterium]|nr:MAG: transglutaminase domain-containing protein [candidate division WOR-3 bacterium]